MFHVGLLFFKVRVSGACCLRLSVHPCRTTTSVYAPAFSPILTNVTSFSPGPYHACAVVANGSLYCWYVLVHIASVFYFAPIVCVICRGQSKYGQLGIGTTGGNLLSPVPVNALGASVASVASGVQSTCVLLLNATYVHLYLYSRQFVYSLYDVMFKCGRSVQCMGYNGDGQLGIGVVTSLLSPPSSDLPGLSQCALILLLCPNLSSACPYTRNLFTESCKFPLGRDTRACCSRRQVCGAGAEIRTDKSRCRLQQHGLRHHRQRTLSTT